MNRSLPSFVVALAGLHFLASLAHFSHNAEYLAFYPGMPDWLTRDKVYLAWAAMTSVGLLAFVLLRLNLPLIAILLLAAYGAFGLDALAHYTLALCSEHTLLSNVTIWSEVTTGMLLLLTSLFLFGRRLR
jgi:hypothetical protein